MSTINLLSMTVVKFTMHIAGEPSDYVYQQTLSARSSQI